MGQFFLFHLDRFSGFEMDRNHLEARMRGALKCRRRFLEGGQFFGPKPDDTGKFLIKKG